MADNPRAKRERARKPERPTPPGRPATASGGEAAHGAIIELIRGGVLLPGDRLREELLAERLGLSRTPVREALRRLEAEGIVEHRARVGAVIRRLGHAEIVELYEMRMVLERTAAQMAARHGLAAEFDTLEALNADLAACPDPVRGAAINQDFHRALHHAGRNRFLLEAARALNNALLLLGPTTYVDPERLSVVVGEHRAIVEALRSGEPGAAGEAAAAHLETSLRYRLKALSS
ncbi:MAG: GntR family transcriptional regulator [Alphaproteobacteria bacterium]|nr:MAG: GntR family transcriptional regulator [Alphaproteobacteria bacterium]